MSVLRLWLVAQSPLQVAETLLDALIEVHPEHEQHQALLVAGAAALVLARAARHLPLQQRCHISHPALGNLTAIGRHGEQFAGTIVGGERHMLRACPDSGLAGLKVGGDLHVFVLRIKRENDRSIGLTGYTCLANWRPMFENSRSAAECCGCPSNVPIGRCATAARGNANKAWPVPGQLHLSYCDCNLPFTSVAEDKKDEDRN